MKRHVLLILCAAAVALGLASIYRPQPASTSPCTSVEAFDRGLCRP